MTKRKAERSKLALIRRLKDIETYKAALLTCKEEDKEFFTRKATVANDESNNLMIKLGITA